MTTRYNTDQDYWRSDDRLVSITLKDIRWELPVGMQGTPDRIIYKKFTWWVFPDKGYNPLKDGEAEDFDGALRAARYWIRQNQNLVYGGDYHEVS